MLIYFPNKLGQIRNGVQKTPFYLKKILKNKSHDVFCNNSLRNKNKMLSHNLKKLYAANAMFNERKINIGGDHSMSIATVADSLNRIRQGKLKVLWFDAHPDINTYKSSKSKNFHGMPLSYLTGISRSPYFPFIINKLPFDNLLYIGIRDIDDYERKIIEEKKIKYISCNDINHNLEKSLDTILNFVKDDPVHLSFDVDSMDPSIIPCTGTTYNEGLNFNTKTILDAIVDTNLINVDITEINLELGNKEERDKTIANTLHLFDKYLDY